MNRRCLGLIAATVATATVSVLEASPPSLNVAGIEIGMSRQDALAALKADNPKLFLSQPTHRVEGIAEPVQPLVNGSVSPNGTSAGENVTLLFTMPPSPGVLWGIQRITNYPAAARPSTDATLAALRNKYGPESVPPTSMPTANLVWVLTRRENNWLPTWRNRPTCIARRRRSFILPMTTWPVSTTSKPGFRRTTRTACRSR